MAELMYLDELCCWDHTTFINFYENWQGYLASLRLPRTTLFDDGGWGLRNSWTMRWEGAKRKKKKQVGN